MRLNPRVLAGFFAAGVITWAVGVTVRAHGKLVTLDVRNMEVRQVVRKVEWQTWESILVESNVQGKVTINVRKVPLEKVLNIIAEQTSSRASMLYPLYSSRKSLATLKTILRGESNSSSGWTNLQNGGFSRSEPMFGGGPGFGGQSGSNSNQLVSLAIRDKNISFTALALNRFARARLVAEDGTWRLINVTLNRVTVPQAIATVAQNVKRKWTTLYILRKEGGPGGPGGAGGPPRMAANDLRSAGARRPGGRGAPEEETDEARAKREELEQQLLGVLPLDERQKVEQAQLERNQQREAAQSLTPEQRRDLGPPSGSPNMAQAMLDRIKNSTPEQRAQQRRTMAQMRPPGR